MSDKTDTTASRPEQPRIDVMVEEMLRPYFAFLEEEEADQSQFRRPINLETLEYDTASLRLDLVKGLRAAGDLLILIGMVSQLKRLATLPMGEMPQAATETQRALEQYRKWIDTSGSFEFKIINELMYRARKLNMTWQSIGEAIGMSAQGAYKKAGDFGHARLIGEPPPSGA